MSSGYNVAMRIFRLYLPESMRQKLDARSAKDGLSVSEHIRRALSAYLEKK